MSDTPPKVSPDLVSSGGSEQRSSGSPATSPAKSVVTNKEPDAKISDNNVDNTSSASTSNGLVSNADANKVLNTNDNERQCAKPGNDDSATLKVNGSPTVHTTGTDTEKSDNFNVERTENKDDTIEHMEVDVEDERDIPEQEQSLKTFATSDSAEDKDSENIEVTQALPSKAPEEVDMAAVQQLGDMNKDVSAEDNVEPATSPKAELTEGKHSAPITEGASTVEAQDQSSTKKVEEKMDVEVKDTALNLTGNVEKNESTQETAKESTSAEGQTYVKDEPLQDPQAQAISAPTEVATPSTSGEPSTSGKRGRKSSGRKRALKEEPYSAAVDTPRPKRVRKPVEAFQMPVHTVTPRRARNPKSSRAADDKVHTKK